MSVCANSFFFYQIRKQLGLILTVFFFVCARTPVTTVLSLMNGDVTDKTLIDYYNFLGDVCTGHFRLHPVMLGGVGTIVQINKSKLGRKKGIWTWQCQK